MTTTAVDYVRGQITNHIRLFFTEPALTFIRSDAVRFLPYAEAAAVRKKQIVIPIDLPRPMQPESPWQVPFNGSVVTLWNPIPHLGGNGWRAMPNDTTPVWYQHESGTVMPAWDLFGNVFDLLTFGEEQRLTQRDRHGRFAWQFSPRHAAGLLGVPAVNEAVALLVDAGVSLARSGGPSFTLDCLAGPPTVVLSHDCDILAGNDFWTQSVRLFRVVHPLTKLRPPRVGNLWWFARNAVTPRRFYFDNATGMVDIEHCFGYTSTYYFLNGSGGRFGARGSFSDVRRLIKRIPQSWDAGIHYNCDTFLNQEKFAAQLEKLQHEAPGPIVSGRAHYLKLDPLQSFVFLRQFGIYADESSGWPDYLGYRNGIAGCFQAFDAKSKAPLDIWEIPLVIVEDALVNRHGADAVRVVERHLTHLSRIGGALTILFHPGAFFNPEFRSTLGVYHRILKLCRQMRVASHTARSLVDRVRGQNRPI